MSLQSMFNFRSSSESLVKRALKTECRDTSEWNASLKNFKMMSKTWSSWIALSFYKCMQHWGHLSFQYHQSAVPQISQSLLQSQSAVPQINHSLLQSQSAVPQINQSLLQKQSAVPQVNQSLIQCQSAVPQINFSVLQYISQQYLKSTSYFCHTS